MLHTPNELAYNRLYCQARHTYVEEIKGRYTFVLFAKWFESGEELFKG